MFLRRGDFEGVLWRIFIYAIFLIYDMCIKVFIPETNAVKFECVYVLIVHILNFNVQNPLLVMIDIHYLQEIQLFPEFLVPHSQCPHQVQAFIKFHITFLPFLSQNSDNGYMNPQKLPIKHDGT